jgi:hypothetical protein
VVGRRCIIIIHGIHMFVLLGLFLVGFVWVHVLVRELGLSFKQDTGVIFGSWSPIVIGSFRLSFGVRVQHTMGWDYQSQSISYRFVFLIGSMGLGHWAMEYLNYLTCI